MAPAWLAFADTTSAPSRTAPAAACGSHPPRSPRDRLDDEPEEQIVGVAVVVAFAGRKVRFLLGPPKRRAVRGSKFFGTVMFSRANCGVSKASKSPLRMLQSSRTVILFAVGYADAQWEAAHGIVEAELPFGDQLQDDAHDERLRVAADAKMVRRRQRSLLCKIGVAERTHEASAVTVPNADQNGGKWVRGPRRSCDPFRRPHTIADWTDEFAAEGVVSCPYAAEGAKTQPKISATANFCMFPISLRPARRTARAGDLGSSGFSVDGCPRSLPVRNPRPRTSARFWQRPSLARVDR